MYDYQCYNAIRIFGFIMVIICIVSLLGQFGVIPGMIKCDDKCDNCCNCCNSICDK